jgi:acetyl esterase
MQALIYPATDAVGGQPSRDTFAAGFLLTKADMDWFEGHYLPPGTDRADPRVSVLRAADLAGLPPAYVATAGFDPLRDEGEAYASRLRDAGVAVTLRRHPGLIHGFANMTEVSRSARAAMLELCSAIRMGLA